jgi:KDO2-lipid IV(A) lauroyltransferase
MGLAGRVTALQYNIARVSFATLGRLPRPLALRLGRALGYAAYLAGWKLRRVGELNLQMAFPAMARDERRRLLRGSIVNLGRHLAEFSRFSIASPETLRGSIDYRGLENLETARARGRGVLVITAHLGAWELIGFGLFALGYPFNFLVRRIENPAIERAVEDIRTRFGNRTIDKRSAARSMLLTLRSGGMLGLAVDINVVRDKGIFVDFFGVRASTTFMAAKLALRTGATVIPIFVPWEERRRRYVLDVGTPLSIEPSGDEKEDIRRLTIAYTRAIENYIRRYPDQWLWIHKRWRTQPLGEPNPYERCAK